MALERQIDLMNQRFKRKMDVGLLSAYHTVKGLNELLTMIDSGTTRFTEQEKQAIHMAHRHITSAYQLIDAVIVDSGNANGNNLQTFANTDAGG